jgi:TetR/AcrR family transcriptional repressor of nem operon
MGEQTRQAAQRPLTSKGRATRARVLEVAAELMFEHGAAATSIDDVKRAAKVSASQVGHYFGDKHALVRAVIEYQTDATLQGQRPLLDHLDSFEALHAWRDLNVAMADSRNCVGGCSMGSLAAELADNDADLRGELASGFTRWLEPIRLGLTAMRERGELQPQADPDELAVSLLAALQGGMLLAQTFRSSTPLATSLDAMLAYLHTLAPAGPS